MVQISAEDLIGQLMPGKKERVGRLGVSGDLLVSGKTFDSQVDLSSCEFEGSVEFSDCTFRNGISFESSSFAALVALTGCRINGQLAARRIQCAGDIRISNTQFGDPSPEARKSCIHYLEAQARASAEKQDRAKAKLPPDFLDRLSATQDILDPELEKQLRVALEWFPRQSRNRAGNTAIDLRDAVIGGNLSLEASILFLPMSTCLADNIRVRQRLLISNCVFSSLSAKEKRGIRLAVPKAFKIARVGWPVTTLSLTSASIEGDCVIQQCSLDRVDLSGSSLSSVTFAGCGVFQDVTATRAKLGCLNFLPAILAYDQSLEAEIGGDSAFVEFFDSVLASKAVFAWANNEITAGRFEREKQEIADKIKYGQIDDEDITQAIANWWEGSWLGDDIVRVRARPLEVRISFVAAINCGLNHHLGKWLPAVLGLANGLTELEGAEGEGAHRRGCVLAKAALKNLIEAFELDKDSDVFGASRARAIMAFAIATGRPVTLVGAVDLTGAEVGEVDFSGALVFGSEDAEFAIPVLARDATITGRVRMTSADFVLEAATARSALRPIPIADFTGAKLYKLDLPNQMPRPVRMVGAAVDQWGDLADDASPGEFLEAVKCVDGGEVALMQEIEQRFRARGRDDAAAEMYVQWRSRARRRWRVAGLTRSLTFEELIRPPPATLATMLQLEARNRDTPSGRSASRRLEARFALLKARDELGRGAVARAPYEISEMVHDRFFGFGTRLLPSITLAFVLFGASWALIAHELPKSLVFRSDHLAALSESYGIPLGSLRNCGSPVRSERLDLPPDIANDVCGDAPGNWSRGEGIVNSGLIALKYHAPMLGLDPLPEVTASGYVLGGQISLVTWLEFMRILNWLLLPLILAVGVARILPRYK